MSVGARARRPWFPRRTLPRSLTLTDPVRRMQLFMLLLGLAAAAVLGVGVGRQSQGWVGWPVELTLAGLIALVVFLRPIAGLLVFVAGLSVAEALPSVPLVSSLLALVGGLTFFAFLIQHRSSAGLTARRLAWPYVAGGAFVVWILATHPAAALHAADRNWVATYLQLLALLWLVARMLRSRGAHQAVMWAFGLGAAASAVIALSQVTVGASFEASERGAGLLGVNSSARYFVVAFIFFAYLAGVVKGGWKRVGVLVLAGVVVAGTIATLSRTGFLLIVVAAGLLVLERVRSGIGRRLIVVGLALGVAALLIPKEAVGVTVPTLSVQSPTHTVITRIELWRAGMEMWWTSPIQGIGVGEFLDRLGQSQTGGVEGLERPHNIVVSLLAETGLVGFALYFLMVWACLSAARRASRDGDPQTQALARTWIIALIVLLIGGITAHDQYEKLLWMTFAACLSFGYWRLGSRREPVSLA